VATGTIMKVVVVIIMMMINMWPVGSFWKAKIQTRPQTFINFLLCDI
jgi:hypothetical protein